ncbi:glycosyltransferase family 4 protein [Caenimonas sedimenti]|uniref:Glycosyltransferase family 4 protein n=1 Tax=Caenimonas sedimenti TaxID=2596921 RepID=A0A562ZU31_9BURK|nr:glycosyltransferase family 1 protein [Caenimonas sedimenti]TWO72109.1 glycosyltransferase family 4 protein [Caenimonas sedimenti]
MRIAVDASMLAADGAGISRYLRSLLEAMLALDDGHEWLLYGRRVPALATGSSRVGGRQDGLPDAPGRILALAASLPLWTARDRPDVFWAPAHRLPLWLPRDCAGVLTVHDLCWQRAPETMRRSSRALDALFMPRSIARADRILAVSQSTARDIAAGFPAAAARTVVVHEGLSPLPEPAGADALAALGLRLPYVLFVGTIEPRKNLQRLIEAFGAVRGSSTAPLQLAVVGAAGWGADIAESAHRHGADQVVVLGRVSDATLATLYRHALCLAMPSLYEGFGLPLLEAMSFGTPVLASDTSSMPEVAGPAGHYVDPLSVASIAQGLRKLAGEPGYRDGLAAHAQAQAGRFRWEQAARDTLEVFAQARQARAARS